MLEDFLRENYIDSLVRIFNKLPLSEMAQKQGYDDCFTYYTLDSEYSTHYPHVHICVRVDNKLWKGKKLRNGSPYKSVGTIRLLPVDSYSLENIMLEDTKKGSYDARILNQDSLKVIIIWLNSTKAGKVSYSESNALRCLKDYLTNNEECKTAEMYYKFLDTKGGVVE